MKIWHLPATGHAGRLRLNPDLYEFGSAALVHIAQLRREIGTLPQQGMAANAVVVFPQPLAGDDLRIERELFAVIPLRQLLLGVVSQREKYQQKEDGSAKKIFLAAEVENDELMISPKGDVLRRRLPTVGRKLRESGVPMP